MRIPDRINKHIITFKALIHYSMDFGINTNDSTIHFHLLKELPGSAQTKIYLKKDELQALFEMKIPVGSLSDKARDLFLVGCYTCQRVSDYSHLSAQNFGYTARGTRVIRIVQQKTQIPVCIPILNENLITIAKKYNDNLPQMCDVLINRYIKIVCKKLSEAVPSLAEPIKTQLTLREKKVEGNGGKEYMRDSEGKTYKPKYEMICTHAARRSGITNLYKTRLFTTLQMMSISGHKKESTFFSYLYQTSKELAEEITDIMMEQQLKPAIKAINEDMF